MRAILWRETIIWDVLRDWSWACFCEYPVQRLLALLLISGNSRSSIAEKFSTCVESFLGWGRANRLVFAPDKNSAKWMKGTLSRGRDPVLMMDKLPVRVIDDVRYLRVTLDRAFFFLPHVRTTAAKAGAVFSALRRVCRSAWSIRTGALKTICSPKYAAQITCTLSHRLLVGSISLPIHRRQRVPLLAGELPED